MDSLSSEVPYIDISALPEEERPFAGAVWFQVRNLAESVSCFADALNAESVSCFADALNLCDRCAAEIGRLDAHITSQMREAESSPVRLARVTKWAELIPVRNSRSQYDRWCFLAGRDGAISLWNFMRALQALKSNLDKTKQLRSMIDMGALNAALRDFHKALPHVKGIRDSVGHRADLTESPSEIKKNSAQPVEKKTLRSVGGGMVGGFDGRVFFQNGYNGKIVEYELSATTLDFIAGIVRKVYGAFPVDAKHHAGRPPKIK